MSITAILRKFGIRSNASIRQLHNPEDGDAYQVWLVKDGEKCAILKQAKGEEEQVYKTHFSNSCDYVPTIYGIADGYILMEYVPGNDLMRCNRQALKLTLESLVKMQEMYWCSASAAIPCCRTNRRSHLNDPRLEKAYDAYLDSFSVIPATLCHDDLLPFNVLVTDNRAVFIDWEAAGMLPYPTSLARLIAHTEEDDNAFFYMENADKSFAIQYFYEHLPKKHGITFDDYQRHLDLCLFHEYCEWVYVGNKYGDRDNDRYRKYRTLALSQAEKLGF